MSILAPERGKSRNLPVIDVCGRRGSAAERAAVARELRAACADTGFFYITGHGTPAALIEQVFHQSHLFFALPDDDKLALVTDKSACRRGYEPSRAQTLEPGAPPDLKEGFLAGLDLPADHPVVRNDPINHGPNQWPEQLPQFKQVMTSYFAEMIRVAEMLMRGLALSLDLADNYFDAFCEAPHRDPAPVALPAAAGECDAR
jgi:isopenicillin N synthase-like dioxygenase